MGYLTATPIDPAAFVASTAEYQRGASVVFFGIVRNHSGGRQVLHLEYEAYARMAEPMLEQLVLAAQRQWALQGVQLLHRIGRVLLGDTAVAIEVSAAHRDEAYQASRFLIDQIKRTVPIWKKEHFADGSSEWSVCQHSSHEHLTMHSAEPHQHPPLEDRGLNLT